MTTRWYAALESLDKTTSQIQEGSGQALGEGAVDTMGRLLILSIVLGLCCGMAIAAHAFSVQDIKLESRLGMPFVAEVPLVMKPHERDQGFVVVIGDEADYKAEGLPRAPVIDQLWPMVIMGPPDSVRIVSTPAIGTAEFDLVLLVHTGQVTIVRNYPVKLSAPLLPDHAAALAGSKRDASVVKVTGKTAAAPKWPSQTHASSASAGSHWVPQLPAHYGPVLPGESLYKIMLRLEVPKAFIWSVAVLTWQHNPKRFVRKNIHGLRAGVYLDLPTDLGAKLVEVDEVSAREMMVRQWEAWRPPKSAVAAQHTVIPAATMTAAVHAVATDAFEEEVEYSAQAILMPEEDAGKGLSVAKLESVLQGLEDRLMQRLFLPEDQREEAADNTVTFVSSTDLQSAIQGLEGRLTQRFEHVVQQRTQVNQTDSFFSQPQLLTRALPTGVTIGWSLASLLSSNSMTIVIFVQHLLLVGLTGGLVWRWYRKRA